MNNDEAHSLWAWVTRYPDGTIGAVGAFLPGMGHTPLMGRSRDAVDELRPLAQSHARSTGQRVWLREYTGAIDHGEA